MLFKDREQAGQQLAKALALYQQDPQAIVLALPRGGVVLGYEIAHSLHLPLDLILVRKLGVPGHEELAFGAIGAKGIQVLNDGVLASMHISESAIEQVIDNEQRELERRDHCYRGDRPFPTLLDKKVILVDDGIATGATMRAAIRVVRMLMPRQIVVAVPVASRQVFDDMETEQVNLVVLATPEPFYGIGMWYGDFPQVSDQDVIHLLTKANF